MAVESLAHPQNQAVSPIKAWWTVALLVLLGIIAFLDRQIIALLVAPIKADLGISDTQISLLQGFAFALLYATCAVPIGFAVDRYSRRGVIFLGVLIWGLATSASGMVNSFAGLMIARIFVGMGEAALAPASYSILSDLFDRTRLAFALSVYSIGSTIGSASALIIGGILVASVGDGLQLPLIGDLRPWQSVLFLAGLPGIACCFLIFLIPEPRRMHVVPGVVTQGAGWNALFRFINRHRRFFLCHVMGFACLMANAYASMTWLPSVLQRSFGWSIMDVGVVLGITTAVTGIIGLLANGSIADRLFASGKHDAHLRYYVWAAAVIGIFGLLAPIFGTTAVLYLALMTPGLVLGNFAGVAAAALQIVTPPPLRGKISALYLMLIGLFGLIVGPAAVALVADHLIGPDNLALALGIVIATLMPVAVLFLASGRAAMRAAVASAG